jgi:hypothetical protein
MDPILILAIIFATFVVSMFAFFTWAVYKQLHEEEESERKAKASH